ncbi:MAG: Mur ligase family protein [Polyangiaceae bacterium]
MKKGASLVVEVGIDEPGQMGRHARMIAPDIVVITALEAEHLAGFGDVETAVREELLMLSERPGARRVLPLSDPEIRGRRGLLRSGDVGVVEEERLDSGEVEWPRRGLCWCQRVSSGHASRVTMRVYSEGERGRPIQTMDLLCPLPGAHNARDLGLAVGAALLLGRSVEEIAGGLSGFEGPLLRSRVVGLARGALLYEDCFNAGPASVRRR